MLHLSQTDTDLLYFVSIRKAAEKLNVQDWEWKSTAELTEDIYGQFPAIHELLLSFRHAYQAWYDEHARINQARASGNLTPQQQKELTDAIQNRDSTRAALLAALP